jgi:hypothetical protein
MKGKYKTFDYAFFFAIVRHIKPDAFGFWHFWWADQFLNADCLEQRRLLFS